MATENHIISVESRLVDGTTQNTANARELHQYLAVQTKFADWVSRRIEEYGFIEGKDYVVTVLKTGKRQNVSKTEYHLSLDMAKELAMVEKTEKGKEARRYFIECERKLKEEMTKQLEAVKPLALPDKTQKHYWMTVNSSGAVLAQVELKDSSCVSEKVDEVFPDVAVLNRQAVIADMDALMGYAYELTTRMNNRMSGLITILGTPPNATQEDADKFWRERARQAGERLSAAADKRWGAVV